MQYTKIDITVQNCLQKTLEKYPQVVTIAEALHKAGGQVFLVGGAVRDLLIGIIPKDLDIEVHNLSLEALESVLKKFGPISTVGKSFGVIRVHGIDVDWSLPRSDSSGRKPMVTVDPHMDARTAFKRRDVTMNAMGIDLHTLELVDPFDGQHDLAQKRLRVTDPQLFIEDPLRFFRVMQFVARFQMQPDDQLNKLCARMDISGVSRERIEEECTKWLLKSKRPSLALDWLDKIGRLKEIFPEVAALKGIAQEPQWHPEGDVYEHTKQALDAAAALSYDSDREKLILMYAALCHDLGKVSTTQKIEGVIKSHGHALVSKRLATKLLKRITRDADLLTSVQKLVAYHMHPLQFVDNGAKLSAYKRLALKLAPQVTLCMLAKLATADRQGRNPHGPKPLTCIPDVVHTFLAQAEKAQVMHKVEAPILYGRDFIDVVAPGPQLGAYVKFAYHLQLQHGITNKEELKQMVLRKMLK
ncbi:MAG: CCA tRNA nucleotidyltransferase [Candidatus Babeliales bacterium]